MWDAKIVFLSFQSQRKIPKDCVCVCVCDTTSEYTKLFFYLFDDFVWFSQAIEGNERENAIKESRNGKLVIRKVETEMRKLKSRANLIIIAVNKCK